MCLDLITAKCLLIAPFKPCNGCPPLCCHKLPLLRPAENMDDRLYDFGPLFHEHPLVCSTILMTR